MKHKPWYKKAVTDVFTSKRIVLLVDAETRAALVAKATDPARRQNPNWSNSLRYMGSGFYRCSECGRRVPGHGGGSYSCLAHRPALSRRAALIDAWVRRAACFWLADQ